jgi:hypothetical protein
MGRPATPRTTAHRNCTRSKPTIAIGSRPLSTKLNKITQQQKRLTNAQHQRHRWIEAQEKPLLGLLAGYCLFQIGSQFELDVLNGQWSRLTDHARLALRRLGGRL